MSDFAVRKKLGTGSSATVYLVELKTNPSGLACDRKPKFALKCFHKKDFDRKNRVRRVLTEHSILCGTDHPFVVALYRTFNENGSVAFLMEHCERGDLYQMLQRVPGAPSQDVRRAGCRRPAVPPRPGLRVQGSEA